MDYIKFIPLKDPFISVAWYLGSVCNYHCSYCVPEFYDGKQKFPHYENFIKFLEKIKENYPTKSIVVMLIGGEVTLWKYLKSFLKECKSRDVSVKIISNGSRSIKWWKNVIDLLDFIVISYHTESASEEHITELMKLIRTKGQLNFMVPPGIFDEAIQIAKRISENGKVMVIPKFLRKNFKTELYPYTKKQLDFFKGPPIGAHYIEKKENQYRGFMILKADKKIIKYRNTKEIFLEKLNLWKGWKCWGGIDNFFVDWAGNIYVGQCRRGKFGNINGQYRLPEKPFICDKEVCNCTQDIIDMRREKIT